MVTLQQEGFLFEPQLGSFCVEFVGNLWVLSPTESRQGYLVTLKLWECDHEWLCVSMCQQCDELVTCPGCITPAV